MLEQRLCYSEERNTWNLFVNGEWYFEGNYEQCSEMMMNNAIDDNDDYYEDDYDDDYAQNMPCDNYGMCAGTSCSNYPKCQGWEK